MKKKKLFVGLGIIIASLVLIVVAYFGWGNYSPDPVGTETVTQGTQMHYGNISVSLNDVDGDTAWIHFYNNGTDESVQKQVKVGDTVDVFGYLIEIKAVKEVANPSILPGSNHGYVKLFMNKL